MQRAEIASPSIYMAHHCMIGYLVPVEDGWGLVDCEGVVVYAAENRLGCYDFAMSHGVEILAVH